MNNKRILSIILVVVMLFGTITTSFGEVGGVGKIDLSKIAEFEDLRKAINTGGNTAFKSREDAIYFRGSFYDTVFPETSINGKDMAFGNVLNKGIFYYGNAGLIPTDSSVAPHLRQKKDSKGNVLYLGWTQDGRQVPNIDYQESTMSNITVVDPQTYVDDLSKPYSGNVRPFKTDYTDPVKVGAMFAPNAKPSEQEVYGKKLINEWAKKTMLRPTGWKPKGVSSGAFTQFYTVDEYMKYVTVTIPPTSKTYGQAVVFFNNNGSQTRRTFMIAPLDDVDYIAVNMAPETEWNEETKTLTVGYKVTGMDPIQWGNMDHWLMSNYDIPEENLKVENIDAYNHTGLGTGNVAFSSKNVRKGSPGLYGIANLKVMDYSLHIMENIESQSTAIREVTYDFSELLADERAESINLNYIVALGVDEYATKENNKINVTIPATAGYDFKLTVPSPEIQASGDTTDIVVNAELVSLNIKDGEEIVTDLTLHDNTGKVLDKQTGIKFTKSKLKQDLKFTINSKDIVDEKDYYVVINADYLLTKSFPEEREKKDKLKDNKVEIKVKKASADFEIKAETSYKSKEKDGKNVDVKFKVALSNTSETISTTVVLYKGSTSIGTQNLTFTGGGEQTVTFSVPEGSLGLGDSTLTAIVNADRGLTKASRNIIINF